jgi:hypothetical protein
MLAHGRITEKRCQAVSRVWTKPQNPAVRQAVKITAYKITI